MEKPSVKSWKNWFFFSLLAKKKNPKCADYWSCQVFHCLQICNLLIRDMLFTDIAALKIQSSCSLPECFIMNPTMNDCALFLKLFYKNNDCVLRSIKKFRTLKFLKRSPVTLNSLRKIIAKFEVSGSLDLHGIEEGNRFRLRQ